MTATFDIQLGAFTASYRAYETSAPVDYDGFGTITLHRHEEAHANDPRWVLVRVEHEQWQLQRYSSGLRSATAVEFGDGERQWVTERLYQRLLQGKAKQEEVGC